MRVAGVVRIDHVMGLQRLFWIPEGASPEQGLYVSMPLEELLAVVAIEAQRLGVDVVGEDLGTVEDGLRDAMLREGLRRTYVAQYAIRVEEDELEEVPVGSVASFATHDTATFAGWWNSVDIDERVQLGLLDAPSAERMRQRRADERRALALALGRTDSDEPNDVLVAVHEYLARSDAGLVMVQLDDLLGETSATNLPGTSTHRANWSRLARLSLEELASSTTLASALAPLSEQRGYPSASNGQQDVYKRQERSPALPVFQARHRTISRAARAARCAQQGSTSRIAATATHRCWLVQWLRTRDRVSPRSEVRRAPIWGTSRRFAAPRRRSARDGCRDPQYDRPPTPNARGAAPAECDRGVWRLCGQRRDLQGRLRSGRHARRSGLAGRSHSGLPTAPRRNCPSLAQSHRTLTMTLLLVGLGFCLLGVLTSALPRTYRVPVTASCAALGCALAFCAAMRVLVTGDTVSFHTTLILPLNGFAMTLDPLGALFIVATALVGFASCVYCIG